MKFGYTIIYVESVAEVMAFYNKAFGLESRFLHESGDYGELETGATALAFASHRLGDSNFKGHYIRTDPTEKPLGVEIALVTDDVSAAYAHALAAGAVAIAPPEHKPWGQTLAYVRSLEGTLVELCSPVPAPSFEKPA